MSRRYRPPEVTVRKRKYKPPREPKPRELDNRARRLEYLREVGRLDPDRKPAVPIRKELRKFYRSPAFRAARARVLSRSEYCCERCGKPDGVEVLATARAWFDPVLKRWLAPGDLLVDLRPAIERGVPILHPCEPEPPIRKRAQVGVAHINHVSWDHADENLACWCCECHMIFDVEKHARTRAERKDGARPLLTAALPNEDQWMTLLSQSIPTSTKKRRRSSAR